MKIDWGKVGLAAGAVGIFAWLAKAAKPAAPVQGLGLTDEEKSNLTAKILGGVVLVGGVVGLYYGVIHDWDKKKLSGTKKKR